jgi:hypothetical protein
MAKNYYESHLLHFDKIRGGLFHNYTKYLYNLLLPYRIFHYLVEVGYMEVVNVRRHRHPYNGRRYVVNTSSLSKEIHDLDNEKDGCKIDRINTSNIQMLDTYSEVLNYIRMNPSFDGCGTV